MPASKSTASCSDPLHSVCQWSVAVSLLETRWTELCSLASVAPCWEGALGSDGACGCSGEMAALSRRLLWLEDFIWIPHCPLSFPRQFRRDNPVAKPGLGVLTSYMWPMSIS